jgi:hypothetical protein
MVAAGPGGAAAGRGALMNQHVDRIPPLELTLADAVRITVGQEQRWAPVIGLVRAGQSVAITCAGLDRALVLPAGVPVVVLRGADETDDVDLEESMSGWYAGDVDSAGAAAAQRARGAAPPLRGSGVVAAAAAGLSRDPSLVGIYGGDLDHVVDAMGGGDPNVAARELRVAAIQRTLAAGRVEHAPQPGEAETDEITEAVEARMAGWYAGDVGYVTEHGEEHAPARTPNGTAQPPPRDRG